MDRVAAAVAILCLQSSVERHDLSWFKSFAIACDMAVSD